MAAAAIVVVMRRSQDDVPGRKQAAHRQPYVATLGSLHNDGVGADRDQAGSCYLAIG